MSEFKVLKTINVTPSKISPNGSSFIKAFEILCRNLEAFSTTGSFLSFYDTKIVSKGSWASYSKGFSSPH